MTGRSVAITGKAQVEIMPCESKDPGPLQVLVRAQSTLISPGTERAGLLQLPNTNIQSRLPYVGGDGFAGIVEKVGASVAQFKPGDRVYSQLNHKEYQLADPAYLFHIPECLASEEATFATLLHTSLQAVRKGRLEIGTSVLIIGLGLVGQLACRLARLTGALPVIGVDISEVRRKKAATVCDETFDPNAADFKEKLLAATGGNGPEVVIEATGSPDVIKNALQLAAKMGRVVLLGSSRGETNGINFYRDVHKRGLTIYGAHITSEPANERQPHLWPRKLEEPLCLNLMASGRIKVSDLISDRYPVNDAPKAYARLAEWDESLMGMILNWTI